MDLSDEGIEHADPVALVEQRLGEMATDETGPAGDQNPVGHTLEHSSTQQM